jgi:hypothetical protein
MLGSMAYVMAELPADGSKGSSMEQPCTKPHWGFVIEGSLTFVTDDRRETIPAGRAFHVRAGGPEHHFEARGAVVVAGFEPVEPDVQVSDAQLAAAGFELLTDLDDSSTAVPEIAEVDVPAGQIETETWPMSGFVLARVRMGERSGYTSGWCDMPHWGMVTAGRLAIEWEDDVEILSPGDVFHCPAGPPGHRLQAADPATLVDLTPVRAFDTTARTADWRQAPRPATKRPTGGIAVAALG